MSAKKLFIPALKTEMELAEDWTFTLHYESRNETLQYLVDPRYKRDWKDAPKTWQVTFPAGTKLLVERIYIRSNQKDFDSVTFRSEYKGQKVRFWVKLDDANKILFV